MVACFCDDVEESQNNKREREREKKANKKSEKKADGNARLKSHTNRQLVKEFISVFEKFLHFFPSLRLM